MDAACLTEHATEILSDSDHSTKVAPTNSRTSLTMGSLGYALKRRLFKSFGRVTPNWLYLGTTPYPHLGEHAQLRWERLAHGGSAILLVFGCSACSERGHLLLMSLYPVSSRNPLAELSSLAGWQCLQYQGKHTIARESIGKSRVSGRGWRGTIASRGMYLSIARKMVRMDTTNC